MVTEEDEVPADEPTERKKRRRVEEDASRPKRKAPLGVLKSHTARVSRVVFGRDAKGAQAYSCGLDSTVRTWDVENGVCTSTIVRLPSSPLHFLQWALTSNACAPQTASSKPFFDLTLSQGLSLALLSFPFLFKMIKFLLQSSVLSPEAFVFFLEPLSDVLQGDIALDLALFIRLDTGLELR